MRADPPGPISISKNSKLGSQGSFSVGFNRRRRRLLPKAALPPYSPGWQPTPITSPISEVMSTTSQRK